MAWIREIPGSDPAAGPGSEAIADVRRVLHALSGRLAALEERVRGIEESLRDEALGGFVPSEAGEGSPVDLPPLPLSQSKGKPVKPWEAAGVGKWTYYSRRREARRKAEREEALDGEAGGDRGEAAGDAVEDSSGPEQ